jgi:hypothetical protein
LYMKAFYGCLLDLVCMLYFYHWFQYSFLARINWLCFVGQWCDLDSTSPRSFELLPTRALAVLQLLGWPWPLVWWLYRLATSSEVCCSDGYIPSVSYSGSLHPLLHTLVPQKLSRGDYVLHLCYVWLVLV